MDAAGTSTAAMAGSSPGLKRATVSSNCSAPLTDCQGLLLRSAAAWGSDVAPPGSPSRFNHSLMNGAVCRRLLCGFTSLDAPIQGDLSVHPGTCPKLYPHNSFPFTFLLLLHYSNGGTILFSFSSSSSSSSHHRGFKTNKGYTLA